MAAKLNLFFYYRSVIMKRISNSLVSVLMALLALGVLFFASCEQDPDPDPIDSNQLVVGPITAGMTKYYSLKTGAEVTGSNIKTNLWDISFTRTRMIQTNSGSTAAALSSGGEGGVWYTEKYKLDDVVFTDKVEGDALLDIYSQDVRKYVLSMSNVYENNLNVMTFAGYANETTQGAGDSNESGTALKTLAYDKKQFYLRESASNYPVTKRVYIIKHGDGARYSKIQITEYEYNSGAASDSYVVKFENLAVEP
jgi:hypothetical protein